MERALLVLWAKAAYEEAMGKWWSCSTCATCPFRGSAAPALTSVGVITVGWGQGWGWGSPCWVSPATEGWHTSTGPKH